MTVEIWSDVMCPFCYLGKKNYEEAIAQFGGEVKTEWKSFQLNPGLGTEGMSTYTYLSETKGLPEAQLKASFEGIRKAGEEKGIRFDFERSVIVNTAAAHRVIQLAKEKGKGDEAEELLFKAHFSEGRDVSSPVLLGEVGAALGFTPAEVESAQTDPRYGEGLEKDLYEARQLGVRGVPFFVIDRKYAVSGAQPVEVFVQTLEKAGARRKLENLTPDGEVCDINGNC